MTSAVYFKLLGMVCLVVLCVSLAYLLPTEPTIFFRETFNGTGA